MSMPANASVLSSDEDVTQIAQSKPARLLRIGVSQLNWWRGAPMIR